MAKSTAKRKPPRPEVRTARALEDIADSLDRLTAAVEETTTVVEVLLSKLMPDAAEEVEERIEEEHT